MNVPFLDLKAQYASIKPEIDEAIHQVLDSCAFAGGPFVQKFENEWAAYCGTKHAIGVGNGTDALWLILTGLGIGAGDEVITAPNSFIATAEAISLSGAKPVFVDVDERIYTLDPGLLEAAITPRTKAIIPVHLFGQMADMDPIMEIARRRGLCVVEDACQAHGATYKGRKAGSIGDAAAFSFYPGKNLGAYGEAGAVTTNDERLAVKIRMLRDHGQSKKYYHELIGWNARMDGIQGAVLSVKLKHLDEWNRARRKVARGYAMEMGESQDIVLPYEAPCSWHIYHVFAVTAENKKSLMADLSESGIQCGIHYPVPIHLQEAYRCPKLQKGSFPVTESCSNRFVSLPIFPEMSEDSIKHVCNCVLSSLAKLRNNATTHPEERKVDSDYSGTRSKSARGIT